MENNVKVIYENHTLRKFDFSSIITDQDNQDIMNISKSIIDSGNYFENSPKFQTKENLFARTEPIWLKMRMSFMFACFMYLGQEVKIKGINSWVFMTSTKHKEDREKLWHEHHYDRSVGKLSGIFYVHIPANVTDYAFAGTEFSPEWPEIENNFFVYPEKFNWLIYPSSIWHRPGPVMSDENRFILAADMEYFY